ncbi:MAG: hypothetical protein ACI8TP_004378 [Acidimicrobiales bacterium]|jgi:hypothetical protein
MSRFDGAPEDWEGRVFRFVDTDPRHLDVVRRSDTDDNYTNLCNGDGAGAVAQVNTDESIGHRRPGRIFTRSSPLTPTKRKSSTEMPRPQSSRHRPVSTASP